MSRFFKGKSSGVNTEMKARLEHKLYLAREDPEPVFDLSDCGLQSIPPGIFSLCKVFRKEALYLQDNQLVSLSGGGNMKDLSLLQVLDLHSNCFSKLPDDIRCLKALKVLNVSSNNLKQLPDAVGCLDRLELLDISHNQLTDLPRCLGNLRCLQELSVVGNKHITSLPAELCHATNLVVIHADPASFTHPPKDIVRQGIQAIMTFLAQEAGVVYEGPPSAGGDDVTTTTPDDRLKARIMQLEKLKATKQKHMLAMTREMDEHQRKEFQLHNTMKANKGRLLNNLMENESKLEDQILRVQQTQEKERLRLIRELVQVENCADQVVSQLLTLRGGTVQDSKEFKRLLEEERRVEEELLDSAYRRHESYRRKDILRAMEAILEEEYQAERKMREYEEGRAITARTLLSQEVDADEQLANLLQSQEGLQTKLISRIQEDEELQRAAVGALLERGDARSWGLVQQVSLVESQLATLTAVEMKRKQLQMSDHINDLCDKRVELSQLLVQLLGQQTDRRRELLKTMEEMEKRHSDKGEDFWLQQYQRLLDSRPGNLGEMERTLEPRLAHHLLLGGVIHCLPFLAQVLSSPDTIAALSARRLQELGISKEDDQKAILVAIRNYRDEAKSGEVEPSAPPETSQLKREESAIGIERAECVVCMEKACEVVFVPCGHMCCCVACGNPLASCPMCRAEIEQKIRVIFP